MEKNADRQSQGQRQTQVAVYIARARSLLDKDENKLAFSELKALRGAIDALDLSDNSNKHLAATYFQLLAVSRWTQHGSKAVEDVVADLDRSIAIEENTETLRLKARALLKADSPKYHEAFLALIAYDDSLQNNLQYILALENQGRHEEAIALFDRQLARPLTAEDIGEINQFLEETGKDRDLTGSGRYFEYHGAFTSRFSLMPLPTKVVIPPLQGLMPAIPLEERHPNVGVEDHTKNFFAKVLEVLKAYPQFCVFGILNLFFVLFPLFGNFPAWYRQSFNVFYCISAVCIVVSYWLGGELWKKPSLIFGWLQTLATFACAMLVSLGIHDYPFDVFSPLPFLFNLIALPIMHWKYIETAARQAYQYIKFQGLERKIASLHFALFGMALSRIILYLKVLEFIAAYFKYPMGRRLIFWVELLFYVNAISISRQTVASIFKKGRRQQCLIGLVMYLGIFYYHFTTVGLGYDLFVTLHKETVIMLLMLLLLALLSIEVSLKIIARLFLFGLVLNAFGEMARVLSKTVTPDILKALWHGINAYNVVFTIVIGLLSVWYARKAATGGTQEPTERKAVTIEAEVVELLPEQTPPAYPGGRAGAPSGSAEP